MNRSVVTMLGLAMVAGAAIWVGRAWLKPASERAQARSKVLTGAYDARVEFCGVLEDNELPEGLEPPAVGSDDRYLRVVVLFPGVTIVKGKKSDFALDRVNGAPGAALHPVHSEKSVEEDGVYLTLTYRTDVDFEYARLMRGNDVIVKELKLE